MARLRIEAIFFEDANLSKICNPWDGFSPLFQDRAFHGMGLIGKTASKSLHLVLLDFSVELNLRHRLSISSV